MAVESESLNKFFEYLNQSGFKYCVMNNYHDYPDVIPSDIDFTIELPLFQQLDQFIKTFADKQGLVVIQKIWHGFHKCAYILSPLSISERFRLQLDFFVDFTAKGYWNLISHEEMVSTARPYKNFYIPSPEIESVFLLMRRIIKNDGTAEKLAEINSFELRSPSLLFEIEKVFGSEMAAFFSRQSKLSPAEFSKDVQKSKEFLRAFSKAKSSIFYRFSYKLSEYPRLLQRALYPVGLSVCFLSPDGGGKTTIINEVTKLADGSFHGINKIYWRPRLLPPMGRLKFWNPSVEVDINPDPHGHAPQHPAKSAVRFGYYLLDYLLGYPAKVFPLKIKKSLVLFDRYYYDFLVDLHRYRMSVPKWLPRLLLPMIPSPDLVVILSCPPDVMALRKKELTIDELRRQHDLYKNLSGILPNCVLVDSNRTIEEVSSEIVRLILEKKATIAGKSLDCK